MKLTSLKELMFTAQTNQKSMVFFTIGIFEIEHLRFNQVSAVEIMMY